MIRTRLACLAVSAALSFGTAHAASTTLNGGGSSLAYPAYEKWFQTYTAAHTTSLFSYAAAGSGAGQSAFLTNNLGYFEPVAGTNPIGYAAGTLTYGTIAGTTVSGTTIPPVVDFGTSDAPLVASQLTNPATGSYAESATDGPLIQIPVLGVAVTVAYNESAQTSTLDLTDAQVCQIFSGGYTDWDQVVTTLPSAPITVVYPTESSGSTYLFTHHLAYVCGTVNGITFSAQKLFALEFPSGVPSNFVGESGSYNVSRELLAQADGIGFLSPEYTSVAPGTITQDPNKTKLMVASLYNPTTQTYFAPTVANTETGLENPATGSTNLTPPSTLTTAMNPLNWVPLIPATTAGYTIVGYATMDLSSCYSTAARGKQVINFMEVISTSAYNTIATNNGLVPLSAIKYVQGWGSPNSYVTPVYDTFLTNTAGYSTPLNIDGTECSAYTGR